MVTSQWSVITKGTLQTIRGGQALIILKSNDDQYCEGMYQAAQ
jgi:hypothetical protein